MTKIEFEILKPGPIAIKVVNIIGRTYSKFMQSYDSAGQCVFDFDEKPLPSGQSYYYKIYEATGLNIGEIEALNGGPRLLKSAKLELRTNGNGKL